MSMKHRITLCMTLARKHPATVRRGYLDGQMLIAMPA